MSSKLEDFPLFQQLPLELRLKIWRYARFKRILEFKVNRCGLVSDTPAPAVLHACKESRSETLRFYQEYPLHPEDSVHIDWNLDIILLNIDQKVYRGLSLVDAVNVRHDWGALAEMTEHLALHQRSLRLYTRSLRSRSPAFIPFANYESLRTLTLISRCEGKGNGVMNVEDVDCSSSAGRSALSRFRERRYGSDYQQMKALQDRNARIQEISVVSATRTENKRDKEEEEKEKQKGILSKMVRMILKRD